MKQMEDLTGCKFNDLEVIEFSHKDSRGRAYWKCRNKHGEITAVRSDNLKRERKDRLRAIWFNMHDRCENVKNRKYRIYGAEGKAVCQEWSEYEAFEKWALSGGYKSDLTLERIDGTKGYSPDNCRWATPKEQANNTRRNHLITYNGETHTMAEWAEITRIPYQTLAKRINVHKWDIESALTTPTRAHKPYQRKKQDDKSRAI